MPAYITTTRRAALLALIAFTAACSNEGTAPRSDDRPPPADTGNGGNNGGNNGGGNNGGQTVASIDIGGDAQVVVTYMGFLSATPRKADGSVAQASVTWQSSDPAILEVNEVGGMIGRRTGTAVVTASAGGRSVTQAVTVVPRMPTSMQVTPWAWQLQRGDVAHIEVLVLDQHRQYLEEAPIAFSVSDPSIVEVVGRELKPLKAGAVTVTITSGNVTATTPLRVAESTTYPLMEINRGALPNVIFESIESMPYGWVKHQLVVTEGSLVLSNSSDRFRHRIVVEERTLSNINGNQMVTKGATHVQEKRGRYVIDATGHVALIADDGESVIGTVTGTRGIELTDYQHSGTKIYHFWR